MDVDMPHVQSRIHSDCDSVESIADSDFEDGELREDYESSRLPIAKEKFAALLQER